MVKAPIKKFSNYKLQISTWVRAHRFEAFCLALILLAGAFCRLYKIDQYMTFLGDEGRDVLIVRRLLVNFDLILVGPGTSIGNMYLGPLYYYLMAPFLFLANYSPVGPAVMVALLGIGTLFLVWKITRELFPAKGIHFGALAATGLYAIAPVVIIYSRSSWNPNIMPFFSLLSIYSIWKILHEQKFLWLIVSGISFAFVLQSHYLGLLLAPVLGLFWLLSFLEIRKIKLKMISFTKLSLIGATLFLFLMSPLVIFDARHGWRNFGAIKTFFTVRQETVSVRPWTSLPKIWPLVTKIDTRLIAGTNPQYGVWVSSLLLIGVLVVAVRKMKNPRSLITSPYFLLFAWLGIALIGLGIYKQEIYDHYYGFFFTAPFLLIGGLSQNFIDFVQRKNFFIRLTSYIFLLISIVLLLTINLADNPLKYPPNRQFGRSIEVSQKIIEESKSREFNIAVIAERNYEGAYQYFLEAWNAPIIMIDPQQSDKTITDQLFVICELPEDKCDPTHNPKAEIANFGWTKIDSKWQVAGVNLYKLTHSI
jgi:4-amino-4-deoxy-L-arabinose transferase-like glycosyltransferase